MKGIIMSAVLWMHMTVMIMGLAWMFQYEHTRNHVVQAHKQALRATIAACSVSQCDQDQALEIFEGYVSYSLTQFDMATLHLMGFSDDPLLIRTVVEVKENMSWYPITIRSDKAMIQEIQYGQ